MTAPRACNDLHRTGRSRTRVVTAIELSEEPFAVNPRPEPRMLRRPRPLALPLALLCLLAYLGSAAHFVLVQHRTCLEHGDLLHAEAVESGATLAPAAPAFDDERFTRGVAMGTEHGSDAHCTHVFLRRVLAPSSVNPLVARVSAPEGVVLAPPSGCVEPPVAWLHLAPKASPPRV
jgi:hypothetical protein